ncbi:MAG: hypothetical protein WAS21_28695 [Geminicoccaceae bacterium]
MTKVGPGTTQFRWRVYRGASYVELLELVDEAGAPLDLTGATIRALIGRSWLQEPLLELTINNGIAVLDVAGGQIKLLLQATQTTTLPLGPAVLELYVTAASGVRRLMLRAVGSVEQTQLAVLGDAVVQGLVDGLTAVLSDLPEVTGEIVGAGEFFPAVDPDRPAGRRSGRRSLATLQTQIGQAVLAALVGSAPEALNSLDKLAAALGDDAGFATTISNALALKASLAALEEGAAPVAAAGVIVAAAGLFAHNANAGFAELAERMGTVEAGQASTGIGYATKAELDADLAHADRSLAWVTNDSVAANNGMFRKSGASGTGSWVAASTDRITTLLPNAGFQVLAPESGYIAAWVDPVTGRSPMRLTVAGKLEIDDVTLPAAAVLLSNLAPAVQSLMPTALSIESGYVWALLDPVTGRAPVRLTIEGALEIDGFALPDESVTEASLAPAMQTLLPATLPIETGYAWALVDPVTGRAPVRVRLDGTFEADSFATGTSTVGMAALAADARRQLAPNARDVVPVRPDVWRGSRGETAALTEADGSLWAELGALRTRWVGGINGSGAALEMRRSAGLPIAGRKYGGAGFDTSVNPSIAYKGDLTSTNPSTPSGSFVAGDFYRYVNGDGAPGTYNATALNVGDLLVYTGSAWVARAAPGTYGSRSRGLWWDVTAAGWWDGIPYAVGERILYVGIQMAGGASRTERWARFAVGSGRCFYRGEFAPGSGLPATYLDGDLFQASAPGSAGGFTFAAGDYLVRDGGAWGVIANTAVVAVASGAYASMPCTADAAEWEVRRQDKAATATGVRFSALTQSVMRRQQDTLTLISDSMFGVAGVGNTIIAAAGRTGSVRTYGGGTSLNVLSMFEWWITQGDPYAGQTLLAWHGQNNQPSNEVNAAQIRAVSLRMVELAGARDARMLFLSVLGQRNHGWNGTRITATQHEAQFNRTGSLYTLNQWYETTFPGRWISPWQVLLAAATDAPDPTFPGMTEKQVAAAYGIVPWSFFGSPGGSWTPAQLVYQGTWTSADLPSGGADLDYYLRIGGGTIGNLLVREAGAWVERSIDITHLSGAGAAALASGGPGQSGIPASSGVAGFLLDNLL